MFEEFDRHADRHSVLYSVLQVVEPVGFEVEAVGHAHIVFSVGSIADIEVLIPFLLSWIADVFQRIYSVHVESELRQCHRHDVSEGVLAVACVGCEVEQTTDARLIGDTRLEGVAEIFVRRDGVVFVIVGAHDINVC